MMLMEDYKKDVKVVEEIAIVGGLIAAQFVYAGNAVVLGYLLSLGINYFSLIVLSASFTFLTITPFALFFERSKWPSRLSCRLFFKLVFMSAGGVTLFQMLFMKGISLTSPSLATAMPNLAPGLIFIISCAFRLEKVKLGCMYSRVKIGGTLLCIVGAVTMSLHRSSKRKNSAEMLSTHRSFFALDMDWVIGCSYLLAAVFTLSLNVVVQASTLVETPAPMSLCAVTSFLGVISTTAVQFIKEHRLQYPLSKQLFLYSVMVGVVSGVCVSFNGWAIKKRGPLFVSVFTPVSTVFSLFISILIFGQYINMGSLVGMLVVFSGLYLVLWAKRKEGYYAEDEFLAEKKPFLV